MQAEVQVFSVHMKQVSLSCWVVTGRLMAEAF